MLKLNLWSEREYLKRPKLKNQKSPSIVDPTSKFICTSIYNVLKRYFESMFEHKNAFSGPEITLTKVLLSFSITFIYIMQNTMVGGGIMTSRENIWV